MGPKSKKSKDDRRYTEEHWLDRQVERYTLLESKEGKDFRCKINSLPAAHQMLAELVENFNNSDRATALFVGISHTLIRKITRYDSKTMGRYTFLKILEAYLLVFPEWYSAKYPFS